MFPGLVALHQMVEVPPSMEHGQLPDDLSHQADHEASVGDEDEASLELRKEIVDGGVLQPGGQHGRPVLDTVVHQEAIKAEVLRVAECRGDELREVEQGQHHQIETKRAVRVSQPSQEHEAQAVSSQTERKYLSIRI